MIQQQTAKIHKKREMKRMLKTFSLFGVKGTLVISEINKWIQIIRHNKIM